MDRFEQAFIQCLRDGVYPGPSNINERYRKDGQRINKLNGEKTKQRLALMHAFGVPYQRGVVTRYYDSYDSRTYKKGIPEWPYLSFDDSKPEQGHRKSEILADGATWELKRK